MSGSRGGKPNVLDDLFQVLLGAPFWVGPLLAFLGFAALRWILPAALPAPAPNDVMKNTLLTVIGGAAPLIAPWVAGAVLLVWLFAELRKWSNRNLLDVQTGTSSIRDLSWQEFERLLAEAFRRDGYAVEQLGGKGADGGIDLRLRRGSEVVLVQCKHWQKWKVDVRVARELYGVVASERATAGILVTSGEFTADAKEFAENAAITLIDGELLTDMIRRVQGSSAPPAEAPLPAILTTATAERPLDATPQCPKCGAIMRLRTAKKGAAAGSQFWGCSRFPDCRSTQPLSA